MRFLSAMLVALVLSVTELAGSSADASPSMAQTWMSVSERFYSSYERIDIRYGLTVPWSCVKDEYGFYDNFKCNDAVRNNAEWEIV